MFRLLIAISVIATLTLLFTRAARAEATLLRVPFLPSIVTPLPPSVFTGTTVSSSSAASTAATLTPLDYRFLSRVARLLDAMRPPASGNPRESAWRNPTLRDPARDRDATSFGIRSAPMSGSGAAFVGAGIGTAAAQFIDLAKVAGKLPVKFGPTMVQGGGGISLRARW